MHCLAIVFLIMSNKFMLEMREEVVTTHGAVRHPKLAQTCADRLPLLISTVHPSLPPSLLSERSALKV